MQYKVKTILFIIVFVATGKLYAQQRVVELTLEQSLEQMLSSSKSVELSNKQLEWANAEKGKLNSHWYPSIGVTGAYVHSINDIEVRQPLDQYTDPAKAYISSIIGDNPLINGILDQIGQMVLTVPLAPRNIATIDATASWPLFTSGKRIIASKIGNQLVDASKIGREQVISASQVKLIECYYTVLLSKHIVEVRQKTESAMAMHYSNAQKLEQNGLITKAERLYVEVNYKEAQRELNSARNNLTTVESALRTMLSMEDSDISLTPTTPLFIANNLPSKESFKASAAEQNYIINELKLKSEIAKNQERLEATDYGPSIGLFAKQTLYSYGVQSNLVPRTMFGAAMNWTLFNGLEREKSIKQARLSQQSATLGAKKAQDDINVAIDKLYGELNNSLDDVSTLGTTIELSEELVRMRNKAFSEGMATSTEVVDAQVMLCKSQIGRLAAYYKYDLTLANLLSICSMTDQFLEYCTNSQLTIDN